MKIVAIIILVFVIVIPGFSQSRKDLIWEYKKLITNDYHLGFRLEQDIEQSSNLAILSVIEKAWSKKKSIILLQLLGYLDNPDCELPIFDTTEIQNAVNKFLIDNNISVDLSSGNSLNQTLFDHYLKSDNVNHLPLLLENSSLKYDDLDILFVAYKSELEFQFWAKSRNKDSSYKFINSYPITDSTVSIVGPKSKYGDSRTPEGIYSVIFYPSFRWSDFYLAFRIQYPNNLDLARRKYWNIGAKAGGDINLHGCCISIGCIPVGNPVVEEIFFVTRENQIRNSNISIMIFPFKFDNEDTKNSHYEKYGNNLKLIKFWRSLENCHKYFNTNLKIPIYDRNQIIGSYILNGT
jgi:murein L,D-transpeptidase YafK